MRFSIDTSDAHRMARDVRAIGKQMAFANVVALTRTAVEAKAAVQEEIRGVFDRPTPFTLGSIYVKTATKEDPEAAVGVKNGGGVAARIVPPAKVLSAEIEGGGRRQKAFERRLEQMGALPKGWFAVPTRYAQIDSFGNLASGQIRQILSQLRSSADIVGPQRRNAVALQRRAEARASGRFFALSAPRGRMRPGVYQRRSSALGAATPRPIVVFVPSVSYRRRLDFHGTVQRAVDVFFEPKLNEAVAQYAVDRS